MKNRINHIKTFTMVLCIAGLGLFIQDTQGQNHIQITYDHSMTTGDTRDYIQTGSLRGGSFEFGHHLTDRVAIGLKVGVHSFFESLEKDTYTEGTTTWYGKQFRYLNSIPTLATVQYNFSGNEKMFIPYAKLGIGGYYFQKRTDLGLYTFTNEYQWNFGIQPEAGLLFPLNEILGINLGARYNYIFSNRSLGDQQYLNIFLGVVFTNLGRP